MNAADEEDIIYASQEEIEDEVGKSRGIVLCLQFLSMFTFFTIQTV